MINLILKNWIFSGVKNEHHFNAGYSLKIPDNERALLYCPHHAVVPEFLCMIIPAPNIKLQDKIMNAVACLRTSSI